jgi:DNA-binding SARP family transcriptional activator
MSRTRMASMSAATLAFAALVVLWLARPAWPHIASLTAPLQTTTVQRIVLCLAWLLGVCLALATLVRAVRATRRPPTHSPTIGLPGLQNPVVGRRRPPAQNRSHRSGGRSAYVLTIPAPIASAPSSPPRPAAETPVRPATVGEDSAKPATISLLGPLTISGQSRRIRRAATHELLAYLALHPHGASRDELIEAIWPGEDPERTRQRFWQSVSEARRALGQAWLHHGERYQLDRAKVHIDLDELERLLAVNDPEREPAAIEAAAALWRGEPLAGADYLWADGEIRRLHATFLDLLVRVGHARLASGDPRAALAAAEQAIALDDLHEPSWRLALQAEHALGLRSSLTQRYEQLTDTLDEQLGLQPSHETRMMYRELLQQT